MARYGFGLATLLIAIALMGEAQAGFIIKIQNASLTSGGSGAIDVLISSNATDSLGRFSTQFKIEQISGSGVLEFAAAQSDSERTATSPNYVFLGKLGNGYVSAPGITDKTTITHGDRGTENVAVVGDLLLARLELQHISPVATDAQYRVSLVNSTQTFTRLLDGTGQTIDVSSFSNSGIVTITAVPEPTSSMLTLLGLGSIALGKKWRAKRKKMRV